MRGTPLRARPTSASASPAPYASAVMTERIPLPGRSSASRRASAIGSPKRMKRPPLQLPTATWPIMPAL